MALEESEVSLDLQAENNPQDFGRLQIQWKLSALSGFFSLKVLGGGGDYKQL